MAQSDIKPLSTESVKQGLVRPKDLVTVYATGSKFMKAGKAYEVHASIAEKLIAEKKATKEAPKTKEAK